MKNMKIIVLGSTGMLGNYVEKYLKKKYDVISLNRDKLVIQLTLSTPYLDWDRTSP